MMNHADGLLRAKKVYDDLCTFLDERNWKYERFDDNLVVMFMTEGEDIPMSFLILVDPFFEVIRVASRRPFSVPEDKRIDMALAICGASYGLADGSFDYNMEEGTISFRLTASFKESNIGEQLFEYLIVFSDLVVDRFNDKFLALCKGLIDVDEFIKRP